MLAFGIKIVCLYITLVVNHGVATSEYYDEDSRYDDISEKMGQRPSIPVAGNDAPPDTHDRLQQNHHQEVRTEDSVKDVEDSGSRMRRLQPTIFPGKTSSWQEDERIKDVIQDMLIGRSNLPDEPSTTDTSVESETHEANKIVQSQILKRSAYQIADKELDNELEKLLKLQLKFDSNPKTTKSSDMISHDGNANGENDINYTISSFDTNQLLSDDANSGDQKFSQNVLLVPTQSTETSSVERMPDDDLINRVQADDNHKYFVVFPNRTKWVTKTVAQRKTKHASNRISNYDSEIEDGMGTDDVEETSTEIPLGDDMDNDITTKYSKAYKYDSQYLTTSRQVLDDDVTEASSTVVAANYTKPTRTPLPYFNIHNYRKQLMMKKLEEAQFAKTKFPINNTVETVVGEYIPVHSHTSDPNTTDEATSRTEEVNGIASAITYEFKEVKKEQTNKKDLWLMFPLDLSKPQQERQGGGPRVFEEYSYFDELLKNLNGTGNTTGINGTDAGNATEAPTTTAAPTTTQLKNATEDKLDVPALLAIVADLVYDYETNLTEWLNETLHDRFGIPTCKTLPTMTPALDYVVNLTKEGSVISKCFVCGLEEKGIPRSAYCSDAFAGEFIPVMPIDPMAKSKMGLYRKYCKYRNVYGAYFNASDRKSIYGRWTGGCSVRWTDLASVYTQRSCRNKNRALTGKHYVSKRMAKLENALKNVDDGCIVSPMAVLTPMSRGISLFARYHACVCSGNWCNVATPLQMSLSVLLFILFMTELYRHYTFKVK